MRLQDFDTLALAKAHEVVSYRKISGNQASQFFGIYGVLDALESNVNNATLTNVLPNTPTSVGALCRTVLQTISNDGFASDPATMDGIVNRLASVVLVAAGIYDEEVAGLFWAMGKDVSLPFKNATAHDWAVANNDLTRFKKIDVSAFQQNRCQITVDASLSAEFEAHAPQVYIEIFGKKERLSGFGLISESGDYTCVVNNHRDVWVDDCYGVVV
jgi:hypothetical protein